MLSTVDLCTRFSKMGTPLNSANGVTLTPGGVTAESEEVRTLFVSGLPMDVRLRELYLLFRCYEGYEGSFLKLISSKPGKSPQPIAFVSFKSRRQAEKALDELQGVRFDPASSQTLRLEFAHTNSRVSPRQPMAASPGYYQAHKNGTFAQQTAQGLVGMTTDTWSPRMPMPVPYQNFSHMSASPSPTLSPVPSYPHLSMLNVLSDSDSSPAQSPTPPSSASTLTQPPLNNTPCSTLFVANLDLQNTEEEIGSIFGSCRGFIKAKMFSRGGPPVAFVEFKDVECATEAMEHLQGFTLLTSKRVNSGIRIEYAKQRMGEQPSRSPATLDGNSPSPIQTIQSTPAQHSPSPQSISGSPSPLVQGDVSPPRPQQLPVVSGAGFSTPISMVYSNGYSPQAHLFMNGFSSPIIPTWHFKPADQQSN